MASQKRRASAPAGSSQQCSVEDVSQDQPHKMSLRSRGALCDVKDVDNHRALGATNKRVRLRGPNTSEGSTEPDVKLTRMTAMQLGGNRVRAPSSSASTASISSASSSSSTIDEVEMLDDACSAESSSTKQRDASLDEFQQLESGTLDAVHLSYIKEGKMASHHAAKCRQRRDIERRRRCIVTPAQICEHDVIDRHDPAAVVEYAENIHQRAKELEERYSPTTYMHTQQDINGKMRAILIDWIVEVHLKFKLAPPTLYLTCHLIDRYCMVEPVHRSKLQLVGVTSMLIACKYEEIYPPEVRDCVYITDNAYEKADVLDMEQKILKRLQFNITVPTAYNFLVRYLKVAKATDKEIQRANYFAERCLQEHDILCFRPSLLAAAAVYLCRVPEYGPRDAWSPTLEKYCNVHVDLLQPITHLMIRFLKAEPVTASRRKLVAVKKKFGQERFLAVALEDLPERPNLSETELQP